MRWLGFALVGPLAFAASLAPASAQDRPPLDTEVATAKVVLDPTDFDPVTITDTEVARMRSMVRSEQFSAALVDQRARRLLAETEADLRDTRRELEFGVDELARYENTLGSAAIEGFMSDSESDGVAFLGLYVEADTTFADETATQLLARREEARDAVDAAEAALDRAERAHRVAVLRIQRTERSVRLAEERQEQFEQLVAEQVIAAERADRDAAARSGEVELRSVAGSIIVDVSIEDDIDRLIADIRAEGMDVGGGGYRTVEAQIALRLAHCGGANPPVLDMPSEEATPEQLAAHDAAVAEYRNHVIYEMPAGACSPPTAKPGNSEHQAGLAIDFTQDGQILDADAELFHWLVEHAEDYGLYNLPSEAWHWSTTGN